MDFLLTTLKENVKKVGHIDDDAIQPVTGNSNLIEDDLCHDFESKYFSLQKKLQKNDVFIVVINSLVHTTISNIPIGFLLVKNLPHY